MIKRITTALLVLLVSFLVTSLTIVAAPSNWAAEFV